MIGDMLRYVFLNKYIRKYVNKNSNYKYDITKKFRQNYIDYRVMEGVI